MKLGSVWDDVNRYETSTIGLLDMALFVDYSFITSEFA